MAKILDETQMESSFDEIQYPRWCLIMFEYVQYDDSMMPRKRFNPKGKKARKLQQLASFFQGILTLSPLQQLAQDKQAGGLTGDGNNGRFPGAPSGEARCW